MTTDNNSNMAAAAAATVGHSESYEEVSGVVLPRTSSAAAGAAARKNNDAAAAATTTGGGGSGDTTPSTSAALQTATTTSTATADGAGEATTKATATTATSHEEDDVATTHPPESQPPTQQQPTVFKPPNELAWDARVEELLEYKRKFGNTDVPNTYDDNPSLARWVGDQRRSYKRGNMARHRIDRLEEIGFLWSKALKSPWEIKWDSRFEELQRFMYKYGQIGTTLNGNVHPQWHTLAEWANHQRKRYKDGKLRKDLVDKLESIQFLWDTESFLWDKHYNLLIKVQRDKKNPDDPTAFRRWVTKQRDAYHDGTLSKDRIDRLNDVDFHWGDPTSSTSTSVSAHDTSAANDPLLASIRHRSQDDEDISNHLDDDDDEDDDDYDDRSSSNAARPRRSPTSRAHHRAQQPSSSPNDEQRQQLMAALANWDVNYKALIKFKKEHGHLNVSHDHRKYASLASWCRDIRTLHRRRELGGDKKKKLKDLGFRWASRKTGPKASWEERFAQLQELLKQHHGMEGLLHYAAAAESLRSKSDDPSLLETIVSWVDYQRVLRKHHKLDQDKIDRLTAVGLVWDAHQAAWDARYKQLVAHTEHGIKPRDYSSYVKWEHRQRREYRLGTLNHDRIQRLNAIGFRWEPRPTRRRASNQSYTSRNSSDGGFGTGDHLGDDSHRGGGVGGGGIPHDGSNLSAEAAATASAAGAAAASSSWDDSRSGPRGRRRNRHDSYDDTEDASATAGYDGVGTTPKAKRFKASPTSSLDGDTEHTYDDDRRRSMSDNDDDDEEEAARDYHDYDDDDDEDPDDTNRGDDDDNYDHGAVEGDPSRRLYQDYSTYAE